MGWEGGRQESQGKRKTAWPFGKWVDKYGWGRCGEMVVESALGGGSGQGKI